jgi:NAD(P)-dependent dehydrogenase (short-subunit alcohol dehydrogenase family)
MAIGLTGAPSGGHGGDVVIPGMHPSMPAPYSHDVDLQLKGKRALVTGGSRGIGKAVARTLLDEGADVVIAARDPDRLEACAAELGEGGGTVVPFVADTGRDDSVAALVAWATEALGGVDILVNSAARPSGQAPPPRLADVTDEIFFDDVNVKVMGYLRCCREVAPQMIGRAWGRIVNIGGLGARQTGAMVTSMRNMAVAALTKNLADELGPHGINVTCVHPGAVRTEATPAVMAARAEQWGISVEAAEARLGLGFGIRRMVEADEVASVVAFLASPRAVAINGDVIAAGGGMVGPIYY